MRFAVSALIALLICSATARPLEVEKRAQCQATLNTAVSVASRLQSHYYNANTGRFNDVLWTNANALEDYHNLMLATGTDEFSSLADSSEIGKYANSGAAWEPFLGGSNDDAGWIVLSLWKMADYKNARGKDASSFTNGAYKIYDIIAGQWDDSVCGGGVWWSTAHTYKNAVTNELFLFLSASAYIRTGQQKYLDNAKKTWTWLLNSGMRNSDGLFNDGLTSDCKNNGQTTWIYNQGVIAAGLGALYKITGDASLLDQAEITLDATVNRLSQNNILKESCDNAASSAGACNTDQQMFKGIWTKHLQFYLDNAASSSRTAKYSGFLGSQTSAVFHYGTNGNNDIGSVWYAPNQGGSQFTSQSSTSGLAAHVAAAKYGPC